MMTLLSRPRERTKPSYACVKIRATASYTIDVVFE